MAFRSSRINILVRVLLIAVLLFFSAYFIFDGANYLRSGYFALFAALAVYELFRYLDRTNRKLNTLFRSILEEDFTTRFSTGTASTSERALFDSLNQITAKFQQIGADREAQLLFQSFLIENLTLGVLVLNNKGEVILTNENFRELSGARYLTSLDALQKLNPSLHQAINRASESMLTMYQPTAEKKFSITISSLKIEHDIHKLITFQNVEEELEAGEVEAWRKLIRVLTHEIMNSVTPVTSLSDTLISILSADHNKKQVKGDDLDNVRKGLVAIKDRTTGLQEFTESYKNLTRIPQPKKATIESQDLIAQLKILLSNEFEKEKIYVHYNSNPQDLKFEADISQILQVILNLFKNSINALQETSEPKIYFSISKTEADRVKIVVEDNGPGISEENVGKIFIPFFTTRKNGTGIGLPLSREIVRQHGGRLNVVSSQKENRTRFTIIL